MAIIPNVLGIRADVKRRERIPENRLSCVDARRLDRTPLDHASMLFN
jgi:hypothetical protein